MYTGHFSASYGVMVVLHTGSDTDDAGYAAGLEASRRLFDSNVGNPSILLVEMVAGHAQMPAKWRKRFADLETHHPTVVAIVAPSPVVRGIATAVLWLRRENPREKVMIFGTPNEAFDGLAPLAGGRLGLIRELHARAWEAATTGGGSVARQKVSGRLEAPRLAGGNRLT